MVKKRQTKTKKKKVSSKKTPSKKAPIKSMKVGFIGLGKLGLPCAVAADLKGHDVMGYDINPDRMQKSSINYRETGPNGKSPLQPLLRKSNLKFGSIEEVVKHSKIIFVAIQTPHEERFEGISRIPHERIDFNYELLVKGVAEVSKSIEKLGKNKIVVIISTVLPGTLKERIFPVINKHVKLCYNPFFIAMGTTMHDFLNPEFVLFGVVDNNAARTVEKFYKTLHNAPFYRTTLENAELIKVAYNTFIGMKIVYANVMMEICHKIGGTMDVDAITDAMKLATNRLISPKYLSAGMGDGGGCHPRDNIALSWLSRKHNLSYDFFEALMMAREKQTEWLAKLILEHKELPKVILGKAFKPETNIITGSPSILLQNILEEMGHDVTIYDPYLDGDMSDWGASVFFIGTMHPQFAKMTFPKGSVVLDPWRYIPKQKNVKIIYIGAPNK
jgi:UDPglucose 6-dehydrogenase